MSSSSLPELPPSSSFVNKYSWRSEFSFSVSDLDLRVSLFRLPFYFSYKIKPTKHELRPKEQRRIMSMSLIELWPVRTCHGLDMINLVIAHAQRLMTYKSSNRTIRI